jgi:hypothetical protein
MRNTEKQMWVCLRLKKARGAAKLRVSWKEQHDFASPAMQQQAQGLHGNEEPVSANRCDEQRADLTAIEMNARQDLTYCVCV